MRLIGFLICLFVTGFTFSQNKPYTIGEQFVIKSKILNEDRPINVYLPMNFSIVDTTSYNVIYVLDGSQHEDFLHIVGLVQFFELQMSIPPTIVVGISNIDRKRDFTQFPSDTSMLSILPTAGGSSAFIDFLGNELKPAIKQRYGVSDKSTIIGQSLGGLLLTQIIYEKIDLFTNYIVVSPSLWWDNKALLKSNPKISNPQKNTRILISVGAEGMVMKSVAKSLFKKLKKFDQLKVDYNYLPKENHATILHNAVYQSFQKLFN